MSAAVKKKRPLEPPLAFPRGDFLQRHQRGVRFAGYRHLVHLRIAKGAWPIEDHRPDGTTVQALARTYEIPYRCLLPRKVEGLLIAGRCLSADHAAHASVRVMAQCMAMGQAAGLAAAITSRRSVLLRQLSIEKLKDRLRKIGAVI